MTDRREPRTEAGRRFVASASMKVGWVLDAVLAIEAEAGKLDVERLAQAMQTTLGRGQSWVAKQVADEYERAEPSDGYVLAETRERTP